MQTFEKIRANKPSPLNLNYTLSPMCRIMGQKKGKMNMLPQDHRVRSLL